MIHYSIGYANPTTQIIEFEAIFPTNDQEKLNLALPAWRPGRYQIANFAKNIKKIEAFDEAGNSVFIRKVAKDSWEVSCSGLKKIKLRYAYYASQMDAGGSWLDDEQLYVNFINCAIYPPEAMDSACTIAFNLPESYQLATALPQQGVHELVAEDIHQLLDSPVIASPSLLHLKYVVANTTFHIWIQGKHNLYKDKLIADFKAFSHVQIALFGDFPCADYHFLLQFLPYQHYHGVEHQFSTVITLGPSYAIHQHNLYDALMGISSHELFHTWNVTRIRSEALVPYQYQQENYFEEGFIAEGFTTYYGDLLLSRSGYFTTEAFLECINKWLNRHYGEEGWKNEGIAASSFDLWLDGYETVVPEKKVSIYIKGALIALLLDLTIRKATEHSHSLDDVMRYLWEEYKKSRPQQYKGFSKDKILLFIHSLSNGTTGDFFEEFVQGTVDIAPALESLLPSVGCALTVKENDNHLARKYGIKVQRSTTILIHQLAENSPGYAKLMKNDEIVAINGFKASFNEMNDQAAAQEQLSITVFRKSRLLHFVLENKGNTFWTQYEVVKVDQNTSLFENWCR